MLRINAITILVAAMMIAAAIPCRADAYPASDDMRRLAAEIIVMRSDAERLVKGLALDAREQKALAERISGAAAFLPILVRRASDHDPNAEIAKLRAAIKEKDWPQTIAILRQLGIRFPFDDTGLVLSENTPEAVRLGAELHETYCSGCHDGGDPEQWLPTPELAILAKKLPKNDLAARFSTAFAATGRRRSRNRCRPATSPP